MKCRSDGPEYSRTSTLRGSHCGIGGLGLQHDSRKPGSGAPVLHSLSGDQRARGSRLPEPTAFRTTGFGARANGWVRGCLSKREAAGAEAALLWIDGEVELASSLIAWISRSSD